MNRKERLAASAERVAKRKSNAEFQRRVAGRPKLPSIKALKNKLWDLNTLAVRKRDGPMCRVCKVNPGYCQNHIVPQCEGPGLIYEILNIFWGCSACNFNEKNRRGHWQRVVFPQIFTPELVDKLWAMSRKPSQLRRPELMQLISEREAYLGAR